MRRRPRSLSALVISAYLCAALLPCVPSELARTLRAPPMRPPAVASSAHAASDPAAAWGESIRRPHHAHAPGVARPRPAPVADPATGTSAHDHGAHDHGAHDRAARDAASESGGDRSGKQTAIAPRGPSTTGSSAARARDTEPARLVFTAPCLCGCGETRATVGGGASRLGSAVPGEVSARLDVVAVAPATPARPVRFVSRAQPLDPIPI